MTTKRSTDAGETLLEVVLAVLFIGLVVVTLVGGLGTAASLSESHRDVTSAEVELKAGAEALKAATYVPAATTATYALAVSSAPTSSGFKREVTAVKCIATTTSTFDLSSAGSCSSSSVLQSITVAVTSAADGVSESITIIKRKP